MKRIFAFLLTFMMIATMAFPAFADEGSTTVYLNLGDGSCNIGVNGNYAAGAAVEDVVSVDVAWESMDFTYTKGSVGTWNPDTHSYTSASDGSWSTSKSGITVKNHSNVGVEAGFAFTAESGVTTTGTFYTKDQDDTYTAITSADAQKISLATAVGTEVANSPAGTIYFGVSGDAITASKKLGTITVTIAKASASQDDNTSGTWTEVSSLDELEVALRSGGPIKLMEDIGDARIEFAASTTLDLNGKTLGCDSIGAYGEPHELTFDFELKNGRIVINSSPWALDYSLTARVTDCTIMGGNSTDGTITVKEESTLVLSGTVNLEYGIRTQDEGDVVCRAGTYNFDPVPYLDVSMYNVTENGGIWTVTER